MGSISGKPPSVNPSSSISPDGKTLFITLDTTFNPFSVGQGNAKVSYTYACGPVFEVIDSTSVSIPYTTATSPINGN
jgi:hypothetical protein